VTTLTTAPEITKLSELGYEWRHVATQHGLRASPEWLGDLWDPKVCKLYKSMIFGGEIVTVQRRVPDGFLIFAKLASGVHCAREKAEARMAKSAALSERNLERHRLMRLRAPSASEEWMMEDDMEEAIELAIVLLAARREDTFAAAKQRFAHLDHRMQEAYFRQARAAKEFLAYKKFWEFGCEHPFPLTIGQSDMAILATHGVSNVDICSMRCAKPGSRNMLQVKDGHRWHLTSAGVSIWCVRHTRMCIFVALLGFSCLEWLLSDLRSWSLFGFWLVRLSIGGWIDDTWHPSESILYGIYHGADSGIWGRRAVLGTFGERLGNQVW
jgi:hypothetical protein